MNYAIAFGFFKLINYAMFLNSPSYSHPTLTLPQPTSSRPYSFGMMPGDYICGKVSDIYGGRRACMRDDDGNPRAASDLLLLHGLSGRRFLLVMLCIVGTSSEVRTT